MNQFEQNFKCNTNIPTTPIHYLIIVDLCMLLILLLIIITIMYCMVAYCFDKKEDILFLKTALTKTYVL